MQNTRVINRLSRENTQSRFSSSSDSIHSSLFCLSLPELEWTLTLLLLVGGRGMDGGRGILGCPAGLWRPCRLRRLTGEIPSYPSSPKREDPATWEEGSCKPLDLGEGVLEWSESITAGSFSDSWLSRSSTDWVALLLFSSETWLSCSISWRILAFLLFNTNLNFPKRSCSVSSFTIKSTQLYAFTPQDSSLLLH